jgi:hypothetical protein
MMRSQVRTSRLRWSILLSAALHVLAVIALNSVLVPADVANAPEEHRSIRVFFPPREQVVSSCRLTFLQRCRSLGSGQMI